MIDEEFKETKEVKSENKWLFYFFITLITLPVFLILRNLIPFLNWPINLDSIILFILIWISLNFLISPIKKLIYVLLAILVGVLLYGSIFGDYGIGRFVGDYKDLIRNMRESDTPIGTLKEALTPDNTYKYKEIVDKVNSSELILEKAEELSNEFEAYSEDEFSEHQVVKCLSVYKNVKARWVYLKDLETYHAYASESIRSFMGDFDDYAILMCALIKSIGGEARIRKVNGILHPELYIGDKKDIPAVKQLIKTKLFVNESDRQEVVFESDTEGRIWLSLSYFGNFPGRLLAKQDPKAIESEIINLNR